MLWITALEGSPVLMTHSRETSDEARARLAFRYITICALPFSQCGFRHAVLHAPLLAWEEVKAPEQRAFYQYQGRARDLSSPSSPCVIPASRCISRHRARSGPGFSLSGPKLRSGGLPHPGFMFPISSSLVQWQDSSLPTTKTGSGRFHSVCMCA